MKTDYLVIPQSAIRVAEEYAAAQGKSPLSMRLEVFGQRVINYISPHVVFSSLDDFLEHQQELTQRRSRVSLETPLTAVSTRSIQTGKEDVYNLEVRISDGTGEAVLLFPYVQKRVKRAHGFEIIPLEKSTNPLLGTKRGDLITVYDSVYQGDSNLSVKRHWQLFNKDHYQRLQRMIQQPLLRREQNIANAFNGL